MVLVIDMVAKLILSEPQRIQRKKERSHKSLDTDEYEVEEVL
jgi:hypothetical protein